jgi:pantoate--beta-alanine ligase
VREADGLAVSSRNAYLDPRERTAAVSLSRALRAAWDAYRAGERDASRLRQSMIDAVAAEPLAALEYAEVVDSGNFSSPGTLALLAVRIGRTRLIDNHDLTQPYPG